MVSAGLHSIDNLRPYDVVGVVVYTGRDTRVMQNMAGGCREHEHDLR
jgi:hypothetical protein